MHYALSTDRLILSQTGWVSSAMREEMTLVAWRKEGRTRRNQERSIGSKAVLTLLTVYDTAEWHSLPALRVLRQVQYASASHRRPQAFAQDFVVKMLGQSTLLATVQ
jgi:hypothetical protein